MMKNGFIKINRSLLNWEWYHDDITLRVFLHCLLNANWEDKNWEGMTVKRGQFVTSQAKLAKELSTNRQPIRRALSNLKSTNELTITSTAKYTIITVVNYDKYQATNQVSNQQPTKCQPSEVQNSNQQPTKTEEDKNKEYKNNIYAHAREDHFNLAELYQECCPNLEPLVPTENYSSAILKIAQYVTKGYITLNQIKEAFIKANSNDYLTGKVNGKKAEFGWIIRPCNLQNILDGKYDKKPKKTQLENHVYDFDKLERQLLGG